MTIVYHLSFSDRPTVFHVFYISIIMKFYCSPLALTGFLFCDNGFLSFFNLEEGSPFVDSIAPIFLPFFHDLADNCVLIYFKGTALVEPPRPAVTDKLFRDVLFQQLVDQLRLIHKVPCPGKLRKRLVPGV